MDHIGHILGIPPHHATPPAPSQSTPEEKPLETVSTQSHISSQEEIPAQSTFSTQQRELERLLNDIKRSVSALEKLLDVSPTLTLPAATIDAHTQPEAEKIIEGYFDGAHMKDGTGKSYPVPPNYASKSKLVEGDRMKLTITAQGSLMYKQISPVARARLRGKLVQDPSTHQWSVVVDGRHYKVLTAAITFHHGKPGHEVIILVPEDGESNWAAVEHIVK